MAELIELPASKCEFDQIMKYHFCNRPPVARLIWSTPEGEKKTARVCLKHGPGGLARVEKIEAGQPTHRPLKAVQ